MRKTGLLYLGHPDYVGRETDLILKDIQKALAPLPLICTGQNAVACTEAEAVAGVNRLLGEENCCAVILVLASWLECPVAMAALKELRGRPCMFWGFPPTQVEGETVSTGAYVSATMISGVVNRLHLPCPMVYTGWQEEETIRRIENFSRAAAAMDALFYDKIGLFGYTSMSIYTGTFDHVLMRWRIGPEVEQLDTYSLIRAAEAVPSQEIDEAIARLKGCACLKNDVQPDMLKKTMAIYCALRRFCRERKWQAVNVKCQYELSKEYKAVPCVALSLLAEDGITASCEGDILNTVSMLLLQHLSGQTVWYGDSLTCSGNVLQFSPCGFLPLSMSCGTPNIQKFMEHPGFTGIQVSGVLRPEKVTYLRLVEDIGSYHIIYGTGMGRETTPRGGCMPALNVELDGSIENLNRHYAGQHFALLYGDWAEQIALFAQLMGIPAHRM